MGVVSARVLGARVLAAHGTRDPVGQATVEAIRAAVAARVGPLHIGWLDVLTPTLDEVLAQFAGAGQRPVVIPLLLSEGYHLLDEVPGGKPALGDDPLLIEALAARLVEAGWQGEDIVLAGTGSARDSWHALVALVADALARRLGVRCTAGVLSGPGISVSDQITRSRGNVAVAAYLLAEGYFHRRLRALAEKHAGVTLVSKPLGTHPALIDLLVERGGGSC